MLRAAALVLAGMAVGACGQTAPDLFAVSRTGSIAGAGLTLRVTDDGRVACNGGALREMSSDELLAAREAARQLDKPAAARLALPPRPGSVLRYRVRTSKGTVSFADNSRGQPQATFVMAELVRRLAQGPCHLPR